MKNEKLDVDETNWTPEIELTSLTAARSARVCVHSFFFSELHFLEIYEG